MGPVMGAVIHARTTARLVPRFCDYGRRVQADESLDWASFGTGSDACMRNLLVAAVVVGVGSFFGAKHYVQNKAAEDLDALLAQARPFVDIEYEQVVATIRGELRVEDVTIRLPQFDDALTVESVGVLTPGFLFLLGFDRQELEFPEHLGVELTGLRVNADADFMRTLDELHEAQVAAIELTPADHCAATYGMTPAALKRLGYHEVVMDLNASLRTVATRLVVRARGGDRGHVRARRGADARRRGSEGHGAWSTAVASRWAARLRRSVAERPHRPALRGAAGDARRRHRGAMREEFRLWRATTAWSSMRR